MALGVLAEDSSQHFRHGDHAQSPPHGCQRPQDLGRQDFAENALEGDAHAGVAVGSRDFEELTLALEGQLPAVINVHLPYVGEVPLVGYQDDG